jgi:hypothetical protein
MRLLLSLIFGLSFIAVFGQNPITTQHYIETYKDFAVREMLIYRIPASVKLAQAILESSSGNSPLALLANNHFGIKCNNTWQGDTFIQDDDTKDECFRKYSNPEESYKDHSLFLRNRPRYTFLFDLPIDDYRAWAYGLKTAGYATNPQYAELIIRQIELYSLFNFDTITHMPVGLSGSPLPLSQNIAINQMKLDNKLDKEHIKPRALNNTENEIVVVSGREIRLNNRVKYIIAGNNETVESICLDLDLMPWQIYRYNELEKGVIIKSGDIIYIQPKRKKTVDKEYYAKEGDNMYFISQKFAIKLLQLYKINNMENGTQPKTGQRIILR